jgi:DNA-binding CsgD family transcriptional regulator
MKIYALKLNVPAGITDLGIEFFSDEVSPKAFRNGKILSYEEFPDEIKEVIYQDLLSRRFALSSLIEWGFEDKDEQIQRYLLCTRSVLDNNPDINEYGILQEPEYVPCEGRGGNCPYEGKICSHLKLKYGIATRREVEVLTMLGEDLLDKQICTTLKIKQSTLRTHKDHLKSKSGMLSKTGLAVIAIKHNLIRQ